MSTIVKKTATCPCKPVVIRHFNSFGGFIVVVKKTSGIQTFFSTTVQALIPQFRISEHYYGKRYKCP